MTESVAANSSWHDERVRALQNLKVASAVPAQGIAIVPVHGMSALSLTGNDVLPFLQSKLTINVKKWMDQGGGYGFAVDVNGRIVFDAHLAQLDEQHVRLWSEPETASNIQAFLERYIILEDVNIRIHNESDQWMVIGDSEQDLDEALGFPMPKPHAYAVHQQTGLYGLARQLRPSRLLLGEATDLRQQLVERGAPYVPWAMWRAHEIEHGFVRTGPDLQVGASIPLEVGFDLGIDYNKGCYLGQEIIERLRSRGTPNKEFRRVSWSQETDVRTTPVPIVDTDGAEMGQLTSACKGSSHHVGIAVIRRRALQDDTMTLRLGTLRGPVIRINGAVQ